MNGFFRLKRGFRFFILLAFFGLPVFFVFFSARSFAQVPSPACLGNCPHSKVVQKSPTNAFVIVTPTPTAPDVSIVNEKPEDVVHSAPCHQAVPEVSGSVKTTEEISHTKKVKKHLPTGKNGDNENRGLIRLLLQMLQMLMQLLQQILGLGGTGLPVVSISPTPVISGNPTPTTLPACPTVTPSPVITSTPSPTSILPSPTASPTNTPTPSPTGSIVPTPTWIRVSPTPIDAVNYSGYYFHFTNPAAGDTIKSTFKAVDVICGTGFISPWPGMGDTWDVEHNLSQLGIDIECVNGAPKYTAWTEALPAVSVYPPNTPVNAGDTITATITYQGDGKFMTTLTNTEQGWSIDTPMDYGSSYIPKGAEVMHEEIGGAGVMPFDSVVFENVLTIGGQEVQMAVQPGLTRLNAEHLLTSDLIGSVFVVDYR